jgi:hypothetical protein
LCSIHQPEVNFTFTVTKTFVQKCKTILTRGFLKEQTRNKIPEDLRYHDADQSIRTIPISYVNTNANLAVSLARFVAFR